MRKNQRTDRVGAFVKLMIRSGMFLARLCGWQGTESELGERLRFLEAKEQQQ